MNGDLVPVPRDIIDKCLAAIPADVNALMQHTLTGMPPLILGGGFIRSIAIGQQPKDIDLFANRSEFALTCADELRGGRKMIVTDNAITLKSDDELPIQIITRWTYGNAADLLKSFDFTCCQAAMWYDSDGTGWMRCTPAFLASIKTRRLCYTSPVRDEDASGSFSRALKFLAQGWTIDDYNMAAVLGRMFRDRDMMGKDKEQRETNVALHARKLFRQAKRRAIGCHEDY